LIGFSVVLLLIKLEPGKIVGVAAPGVAVAAEISLL